MQSIPHHPQRRFPGEPGICRISCLPCRHHHILQASSLSSWGWLVGKRPESCILQARAEALESTHHVHPLDRNSWLLSSIGLAGLEPEESPAWVERGLVRQGGFFSETLLAEQQPGSPEREGRTSIGVSTAPHPLFAF